MWEEIIRFTESKGDEPRTYEAQMHLVTAAWEAGMGDRMIVALSWCLSRFDHIESATDLRALLWRLKWVVGNATGFLNLSRGQILSLEDDLADRLVSAGYSRRPAELLRCYNRLAMGEVESAVELFRIGNDQPRDALSNCQACEIDSSVYYYAFFKDDQVSLETAQPLLDKQRTCQDVPKRTYGKIVCPLIRLGLLDDAAKNYTKSMRQISGKPKFLMAITNQLIYLVRVRELSKAANVIDKHLHLASTSVYDHTRFHFFKAAALAFEAMAAKSPRKRKLRIPQSLSCYQGSDSYSTADLATWFQTEASQLATAFDARNGTGQYVTELQESRKLVEL